MSLRARERRHSPIAIALATALCAALLVAVPLAPPADAAALAVNITRLYDGAVTTGYRDVDINGTLDFAARGGPAIDVQKTVAVGHSSGADCPGAESATTTTGGDVTWCVTVTNIGDTALSDITLDDADLGLTTGDFTLLSGNPALLLRGETASWYVETTESATLDNNITATGNPSNPFGNDIPGLGDVSDTDNATINVVAPAIDIQKTVYTDQDSGASCAGGELVTVASGSDVTYCFSVTNSGNTHLAGVGVDDADLGIDESNMTLLSGDPALVAPGGTVSWYYDATATADLTNTADTNGNPVTSGGADLTGVPDATDSDTAAVDVIAPAVSIDKTVYAGHDAGASCAGGELVTTLSGDDVTYCFTVTNTGDTHLTGVTVDDADLSIDETDMTLLSGDPTLVAPGGTVTWYYDDTTTIDLTNTADTTANPATPGGADLAGIADVTDSDTAQVEVVDPSVTIDKTVYAGHDSGVSCTGDELVWYTTTADELTYCFEITNTGDTHLSVVTIDDTDLGIDGSDLTLLSGNPILLAPGASAIGYYPTSGTGDLLNTVDLVAKPVASDSTDLAGTANVTDSDTATVDEVAPAIEIQTTVYPGHDSGAGCTGVETLTTGDGHPITYCYAVTNTGDTHLAGVTVADPDLGIDETDMTIVSGDPSLVAPGATVVWYFETTNDTALVNTADTAGNPVESDGTDMTGVADPTDSDPATTLIADTAIAIVKTVTTGAVCPGADLVAVPPATAVTYCFAVTNTGGTDLADVTVDDPDLGIDQDDMTVVSGDLTLLAAGDSAVLSYPTTISGDLVNTATTSGDPVDGSGTPIAGLTPPTASDDAEVDELTTSIAIDKTVYVGHNGGTRCDGNQSVTAVADTQVSYCFTVTNTGAAHLSNVTVTDSDLAIDDGDMTLVSGDLTLLAPGDSATLVYETTVDGDLVNTADATGSPSDSGGTPLPGLTPPSDSDTAEVEQISPAIKIEKRAPTPIVPVGYTAEFQITVTNTGDVQLRDVRVSDPLMPACARTIGTLAVGEKVSYTCEGPIGGTTPTVLVNVARATGDVVAACSADPCVSDEDDANVEVVESVLVLEKRALQSEVEKGGIATYSFTITNPTRLTIEDVRLIDETFPECSREIGTLGALQTVSYTCDVTTPEQAGELVNKAYVSGTMLTRSYTSFASAAIMIITTIPGTPISGPLAATGADSSTASSMAALFLVMGFLFLATGRRRRRESVSSDRR